MSTIYDKNRIIIYNPESNSAEDMDYKAVRLADLFLKYYNYNDGYFIVVKDRYTDNNRITEKLLDIGIKVVYNARLDIFEHINDLERFLFHLKYGVPCVQTKEENQSTDTSRNQTSART